MEIFGAAEWISSPWEWLLLFFCALLIGMSKTGMQGITLLAIPLMALSFGARASTGLILPMLCIADVVAVAYYRRSAEWKHILRLLPATILGFGVALLVDHLIPARLFRYVMALTIFGGLVVMLWNERRGGKTKYADSWWYGPLFGLAGGFATMIGNAAAPIMAIYLLSVRLPKYAFVGTSAWFFLVVNFLKLPLQGFVWNNISSSSLALDLYAVPFILLGAWIGVRFVRALPEAGYRKFIIFITILSTIMLLI